MKSRKYGNTKIHGYDSLLEARRAAQLKLMQQVGEISELEEQVTFPLKVNGSLVCKYIADFTYMLKCGKLVVEDVKGARCGSAWATFRIKAKLFKALHGFDVYIWPEK